MFPRRAARACHNARRAPWPAALSRARAPAGPAPGARALAGAEAVGPSPAARCLLGVEAFSEKTPHWASVEALLADGAPEAEAIELLCGAAAAEGDLPRARRLCLRLLALEEAGAGPVPLATWRALTYAHAKGGDADAAFALLRRVEAAAPGSAEVPPEVFEALIGGLVESGRVRAAFETFRRMRTWQLVEPTVPLYVVMLKACALAGDPAHALSLFKELEALGPPPPAARAELVAALASRGYRETFERATEAARLGDPLTLRVCRALATCCARLGAAAEARQLQRRMTAAGLAPDTAIRVDLIRTFGAAARALAPRPPAPAGAGASERGRLLAHAWRVLQDAREAGSIPVDVYNALLQAYCDADLAEHAQELLGMAPELGCTATAASYALVLRALQGRLEGFRAVWRLALADAGVRPSPEMLELALKVAAAAEDSPWARAVLELMFAERVQPSAEAAAAVWALPAGGESAALRRLAAAFLRSGPGPEPAR